MYYVVGMYHDRAHFIYDSSDSSCELIDDICVQGIAIEKYKSKHIWDINKVCMVEGISPEELKRGRRLFRYSAEFLNSRKDVLRCTIGAYVQMIDINKLGGILKGNAQTNVKHYGYPSDNVLVVYLKIDDASKYTDGILRILTVGDVSLNLPRVLSKPNDRQEGYGVVVPIQMLHYVIEIATHKDLNTFFKTFNGLFTTSLILTDHSSGEKCRLRRKGGVNVL